MPTYISPYEGYPVEKWDEVTRVLIEQSPLKKDVIVRIVLEAWSKILSTKIGGVLQVGVDVFPSPQIMGDYLHLLIGALLEKEYPTLWRRERDKNDKDVVCIVHDYYSFEIKTSSQKKIFGNRSYGQDVVGGKSKNGYYLAINFEKFSAENNFKPIITKIKFGWIDHSDWRAQKAASGQQASLSADAWDKKMHTIYEVRRLSKRELKAIVIG